MITLRKATNEEFGEVKSIYSSPHARRYVYGRTEEEIAQLFKQRLAANSHEGLSGVYVLERAGQLVATVNLTQGMFQCDHTMNIGGLVVKKECLGQGFAKQLFEKIEAIAVKAGIKKLQLEVEADNPTAISLYQNVGFLEEGRMKDYVQREGDAFVDEIVMGKKIA